MERVSGKILFGGIALFVFYVIPVMGEGTPVQDRRKTCLFCHGKPDFGEDLGAGRFRLLHVNGEKFQSSVHGKMTCQNCHSDVLSIPHSEYPRIVHCLQCHYEGNIVGAPVKAKPEKFMESVHGKALSKGVPDAPDCGDCHLVHYVRTSTDTLSTVNRRNIPDTCGKCHLKEYTDYSGSAHGMSGRETDYSAATCTDCHREHDLYSPGDPRSSLYKTNVVTMCSKCHADVKLMEKADVLVEQVAAFKESFHGIAGEFGEEGVANCISCHGSHGIIPSSNPRSPIHPSNLAETCGKCHPRATDNVAKGKIHVLAGESSSGMLYIVSMFFKWFTLLILSGLVIHIIIDLFGRIRQRWSRS